MKKGLWLAVVLAAGCGTPPVGVDEATSEPLPAAASAEVRDGMLAARRGGRKLGHEMQQDPVDATICDWAAETGTIECWTSGPTPVSPLAGFTAP